MQFNQRGFKSFKMTTSLAAMSAAAILVVQFTNQPSVGANGEEDQVQLQTTEADFYHRLVLTTEVTVRNLRLQDNL